MRRVALPRPVQSKPRSVTDVTERKKIDLLVNAMQIGIIWRERGVVCIGARRFCCEAVQTYQKSDNARAYVFALNARNQRACDASIDDVA